MKLSLTYRTRHYIGGIILITFFGWMSFQRGTTIPGIYFLDVATHEVGHWLFSPFGELVMLMMGSGSQILFPLVLAVFMLAFRRDALSAAVLFAWAGEACYSTSIYIADAPYGNLPLLGGIDGDWSRILGPDHLSRMSLADEYARDVRLWGIALTLLGLGLCLWGLWKMVRPKAMLLPTPLRAMDRSASEVQAPGAPEEDIWI